MSDAPPPPGDAAAAPRTWRQLLGGFGLSASIATVAALLFVDFWLTRPVNFAPHSDTVAAHIEGTLRSFAPSGQLRRSGPERMERDRARWHAYTFEVTLPANVDKEAVLRILREGLLAREAIVQSAETPQGADLWRAMLGDYPVAEIRVSKAVPQAAPRVDLRPECYALLRDVEEALRWAGVPPDRLRRGISQNREDAERLWTESRLDVTDSGENGADSLFAAVRAAVAGRDTQTARSVSPSGMPTLHVEHGGRPCLDLSIYVPGLARNIGSGAPAPDSRANTEVLAAAAGSAYEDAPFEGELPPEIVEPAAPPEGAHETATPVEPPAEAAAPRTTHSRAAYTVREGPKSYQGTPRIAIILDDGGYGGAGTEQVLALDPRITLAILPYTEHAAATAERAAALGFEIMLHMPMQPVQPEAQPFHGEVAVGMAREEIQRRARAAMAEVPGLSGINNHTGSRFTADRDGMIAFLEVVKEEGLYWVDSMTQGDSIAYDVAREMGVPAARRDVFLDNQNNPEYIRRQFELLLGIAQRQGFAVGIGHFRPVTAAVLAELLPQAVERGFELVHVSEIVE